MQNITKTREVLTQVRLCCLEIAHGCETMAEHEFRPEDLDMLAAAVWELHLAVKPLVKVNPELDHDGDTQPSNDKPSDPAPPWPQIAPAGLPQCGFVAHSVDGLRCNLELGHNGPHYAGPTVRMVEE